jgi:hypothetical protein
MQTKLVVRETHEGNCHIADHVLTVSAVPLNRAAKAIGISTNDVMDLVRRGQLEVVPHQTKPFVTTESLEHYTGRAVQEGLRQLDVGRERRVTATDYGLSSVAEYDEDGAVHICVKLHGVTVVSITRTKDNDGCWRVCCDHFARCCGKLCRHKACRFDAGADMQDVVLMVDYYDEAARAFHDSGFVTGEANHQCARPALEQEATQL